MDNTIILLILSILPVAIILFLVYKKDKEKEPIRLLLTFFICGIISSLLVIAASYILTPIFPIMSTPISEMDTFHVLVYAFLGVALIEEICKWIMVYFIGYYHKEFEELYDIIVYAVFVSLGFAFFENIAYIFQLGNIKTALLRAISAVPGHACDAIFMGYYLSRAKMLHLKKKFNLEKQSIVLSMVVPTILHGIYDFCLMSSDRILIFAFIFFIVFLYIVSIDKIKRLSKINKTIKYKESICPKCGNKVITAVCPHCGLKQEQEKKYD